MPEIELLNPEAFALPLHFVWSFFIGLSPLSERMVLELARLKVGRFGALYAQVRKIYNLTLLYILTPVNSEHSSRWYSSDSQVLGV